MLRFVLFIVALGCILSLRPQLGESIPPACPQALVFEYSSGSEEPPEMIYYDAWQDVPLFTKRKATCETMYSANCLNGTLISQRQCAGASDLVVESRCLTGTFCFNWRRTTQVLPEERLSLHVPTTTGRLCHVPMQSGYVSQYVATVVSNPGWVKADDLAVVAAYAADFEQPGRGDECGPAALRVHANPANASNILLELAESARLRSDGNDSATQALNQLWCLHFAKLSEQLLPSSVLIPLLASDFRTVASMKRHPELWKTVLIEYEPLTSFAHYYHGLARFQTMREPRPRRVLIFTCSFGFGHKAVSSAVYSYLSKKGFEVVVSDTTYEDRFIGVSGLVGAELFNSLIIKHRLYGTYNAYDRLALLNGPHVKPCPQPKCDNSRKQQFRNAILDERPDLIITVYHMELLIVLESAKEMGNIPVMHLATDVDLKMNEIFTTRPVYPKLKIGIPFYLEECMRTRSPVAPEQFFLAGYPVREPFLEPFDPLRAAAEKAKLFPRGTLVLLIMSGGGGQDLEWPYKLAEEGIGRPLHIVVVAGRNNDVASNLRRALPRNKTFSDGRVVWAGSDESTTLEVATDPENRAVDMPHLILPGRLAFLMDVADVMLSKPGGSSTAEIAYRGVPAIFDTSSALFHWELLTVHTFERLGRALTFSHESDFRRILLEASKLGRSSILTLDENGDYIDPRVRIIEASEQLMKVECHGCAVYS